MAYTLLFLALFQRQSLMSDAILYFKRHPSLPVPVTVNGSPFIYLNESSSGQIVNVQGGAVSLIELNAGAGYLPQIGLMGTYLVLPGQSLRITYLVSTPTVNVVTL
jgi:hypothetical protein